MEVNYLFLCFNPHLYLFLILYFKNVGRKIVITLCVCVCIEERNLSKISTS